MTKNYTYESPHFKDQEWVDEIEPELFSVHRDPNQGAGGSSTWLNKIFVDSTPEIWQPDVYLYAKEVAEETGITEIIDVGCGSGEKLIDAFDEKKYNTTGIDYAGSLELVTKNYPKRRWIEANLSDGFAIHDVFREFMDDTPRMYIFSDVIEHIPDLRLLMRAFRQVLKANPKNRLVISTPDPELSTSTAAHGLPRNKAHVREWTLPRLVGFMKSGGFTVLKAGYTRANLQDERGATNLLLVGANEADHNAVLKSYGLPAQKPAIIITTEHADTVSTGGIGAYVQEVERVLGSKKPLVLFCGPRPFDEVQNVPEKPDNLIDIHDLMQPSYSNVHTIDWKSASMTILTAMQTLIFLYDELEVVEYQDYQGVGARLAEAKQSAMLPGDLVMRARCHGAQLYTERASQHWRGIDGVEVQTLERVSLELADSVSSPTQYLLDLYVDGGIDVADRMSVDRLPYSYSDVEPASSYKHMQRIVFLGKRNAMKGYHHFVEFIEALVDPKSPHRNERLQSVVVFGGVGDDHEKYDKRLEDLCRVNGLSVEIGPVPREEILRRQQEYAPDSLFVLPYGADNHPVAVIEMIANYCQFIAYRTGGIPEIIPGKFHEHTICDPSPQGLLELSAQRFKMSAKKNRELVMETREQAVADQKKINAAVRKSYSKRAQEPKASDHTSNFPSDIVSVMVPTYNMDLNYVAELAFALNEQSLQPKEVLFIDDGSKEGYSEKLDAVLNKELKLPYRILKHKVNKGLAGGRNTALDACTTKYLVNADADDIPLNDFVYDYVAALENNPGYAVAACGLKAFKNDIDIWNMRTNEDDDRLRYVGIGGGTVLGMLKNSYGHASSCVRVDVAKELGGWDETDKSKWEDWAFYTRVYGAGHKIFNIPKINYLYRVRGDSMVRSATYNDYPAHLNLVRALSGVQISTWDAYQLYSTMQKYQEIYEQRNDSYEALRRRASVRAALKATTMLDKTPRLKSAAGKVAKLGLKGYKKAKKMRNNK